MKVLVTGAAGFIGGCIAAYLRQHGIQVYTEPVAGGARRDISESALLEVMQGDRPDAVVHAAGSGTVARVTAAPAQEMTANLSALMGMFQYVLGHAPRAHVVLLSSAALYGNAPAEPQRENQARPPVSLYGLVKAQAEDLGAYYCAQHAVPVSAVRLFSVYGPGLRKQLLWDAMNKFAVGRNDFFGTGEEQRDWVHVEDVCRFIVALLAAPAPQVLQVLNCAGGQAVSNAQVLSHLAAAAGAPPPVFNGQTRQGDPSCLVADIALARQRLAWDAQVAWPDGVADYAAWFASQWRQL
jgi:UDP-glucose 4-epimerase